MTFLLEPGPVWPILRWSSGPHLWPPPTTRSHLWLRLLTNYAYFLPRPQFILCWNLKLMPVPQRWAEVLPLPLYPTCLCHVIILLSLPSHYSALHLQYWTERLDQACGILELDLGLGFPVTGALEVTAQRFSCCWPRAPGGEALESTSWHSGLISQMTSICEG
jgi:hypothetical protein